MATLRKVAIALQWIGWIFWLLETAYFGWNWTAQSHAEEMADEIAIWTVFIGVALGIVSAKKTN